MNIRLHFRQNNHSNSQKLQGRSYHTQFRQERQAYTGQQDFSGKLGSDYKHIKSFNPSVSHYRREHAPNRLYLSPQLRIKFLFDDFKERHPEIKVSYDRYKKGVARMNISFVKLGEEECEDCIMYENH